MRPKLLQIAVIAGFLTVAFAVRGEPTIESVLGEFLSAQNNLVQSAADFEAAAQTASAADISAALNSLNSASTDVTDPSVKAAIGKIYNALNKALAAAKVKTEAALNAVNENDPSTLTYNQKKGVINKIKVAASAVSSLATLAKKPIILSGGLAVFGNPSSCNMYNAGQLVTMRIEYPSGCDSAQVSVVNNSDLSNNQAVDASTLSIEPNGTVKFRMGTDWGGATVQVVACGTTNSTLIYNYGKAPIAGLPDGFPTDLPTGTYRLTWSATIVSKVYDSETGTWQTTENDLPATSVGAFKMTNLKTFARILVEAFDGAIASISEPGCTQSFSYSPFADDAFTASYTVSCSATDSSAMTTITFTLTKQ